MKFTQAAKTAMLLRAEGRCESCKTLLESFEFVKVKEGDWGPKSGKVLCKRCKDLWEGEKLSELGF